MWRKVLQLKYLHGALRYCHVQVVQDDIWVLLGPVTLLGSAYADCVLSASPHSWLLRDQCPAFVHRRIHPVQKKQWLLVINNSLQPPMKYSTLYLIIFILLEQAKTPNFFTVFGVMTDPKSVRFTILAHILRGFKLGVFIAMWATGERRAEWYKTLDHWLFN